MRIVTTILCHCLPSNFRVLCDSGHHTDYHCAGQYVPQANRDVVDSVYKMGIWVCFVLGTAAPLQWQVYSLEFGWLVPVAVLFVISFPPVTCCPIALVAISHLFASAIWSRNRLCSLWVGMGFMGWIWNRRCGHFPRRGWQFLVRSYISGLIQHANGHLLIVRLGTVVQEEEKSLNEQIFYTLAWRKLYERGGFKLRSSFGWALFLAIVSFHLLSFIN